MALIFFWLRALRGIDDIGSTTPTFQSEESRAPFYHTPCATDDKLVEDFCPLATYVRFFSCCCCRWTSFRGDVRRRRRPNHHPIRGATDPGRPGLFTGSLCTALLILCCLMIEWLPKFISCYVVMWSFGGKEVSSWVVDEFLSWFFTMTYSWLGSHWLHLQPISATIYARFGCTNTSRVFANTSTVLNFFT